MKLAAYCVKYEICCMVKQLNVLYLQYIRIGLRDKNLLGA